MLSVTAIGTMTMTAHPKTNKALQPVRKAAILFPLISSQSANPLVACRYKRAGRMKPARDTVIPPVTSRT